MLKASPGITVALVAFLTVACGNGERASHNERAPAAGASPDHLDGSGRHRFHCEDGGELLVEVEQNGRVMRIRDRASAAPLVLTARSADGQYSSGSTGARLRKGRLHLDGPRGGERVCRIRPPRKERSLRR